MILFVEKSKKEFSVGPLGAIERKIILKWNICFYVAVQIANEVIAKQIKR